MKSATSIVKGVLYVFCILQASGGLFIVFGNITAIRTADYSPYCIINIVVGVITFIVALLGFFGAYGEVFGFMKAYAIVLVVLLVKEIFTVDHFEVVDLKKTIEKSWRDEINGIPGPMGDIETEVKCCGLNGPHDYSEANLTIPESCYSHNEKSTALLEVGCLAEMENAFVLASKLINAILWTLCGIKGVVLFFVCLLMLQFRLQNAKSRGNCKVTIEM